MRRKLVKGKLNGLIMIFAYAFYEDVYIELDGGYVGVSSDGSIFKSRNLRNREPIQK